MIDFESPEHPDYAFHEEPQPFWTPWRILYAIITIAVIIAFLTMVLWPLLWAVSQPPPPPPPTPILPRV
ncbi:MAG: hypothetical protein K8J31_28620 [Anaerolineae bacterium]|nr:hypothetical protein [Anaerolineae bacterium]